MTMLRLAVSAAGLATISHLALADEVQIKVQVNFLPAPPRTPGYAVWIEGKRVHASSGNEAVTIVVPECSPNTRVDIWPADSRYTAPSMYCDTPLVAQVRYIRTAALLWGDGSSAGVDYADAVLPAFIAIAEAAAEGDEKALTMRNALDTDHSNQLLVDLFRDAGEDAGSPDLELAYQILAVDTTFRAAREDPADGLLRVADDLGIPILTQEGNAKLAEIDPEWLPPIPIEGTSNRTTEIVSGTGTYGRVVRVGELKGLPVFDTDGQLVGQIGGVSQDGQGSVVLEAGGFLGIGESMKALPSDDIMLGEGPTIRTRLDEQGLRALPDFSQEFLSEDAAIEFRFDG
ncbi:PRC-barrel domain-containing protein [Paracoccus sp. TK19116]|uniref:PRC-barrel domain-containing protein n=1 Tax=Paracoccus albicereus TaxID=2922394 RepID=A0ABT1MV72_9RHOB|nr:PRC-barrel domain-containing protein [Paracoccus albicereus]MCQ0972200.1 PRC-barrel domain-containing protein [Paracoccus albicereus]